MPHTIGTGLFHGDALVWLGVGVLVVSGLGALVACTLGHWLLRRKGLKARWVWLAALPICLILFVIGCLILGI